MTGSASRRKGNRAEVEVVRVLREAGYEADTSRNARSGAQGGADIVTNFPAMIEVKNQARLDLATWWKQAQDQAGDQPAIVVHKRVGKGDALEWWVTMDLQTLLNIVAKR